MNTSSLNFPHMINVSQNNVGVATDAASIESRVGLLIRTEPTELFMNPEFGVGLKKFMWQYNSENTRALIKQRIQQKIAQFEPCVDATKIKFVDKEYDPNSVQVINENDKVHITVILPTVYGDEISITI